jgi:hypothetical protein
LEKLADGWRKTRSRYYLAALYEHYLMYLREGEPAEPLLKLLGDRTVIPSSPANDLDYRYESIEPPLCQPIQLAVMLHEGARTIGSISLK